MQCEIYPSALSRLFSTTLNKMDPSPPPALRPIGLAPMQFMQSTDDQIARSRALATAADPDVAQRNVYGYTGSGYGNYSTAERQAAAGLASMYYGRPMMGVRFQGDARTIQGGARTKPMKGARTVRSPKRKSRSRTTRSSRTRSPRRRRRGSMVSSVSQY